MPAHKFPEITGGKVMGTYEVIRREDNPVGVIGWVTYTIRFNDPKGTFSLTNIIASELPTAIEAAEKMGYVKS